jgi:cyclic beta-1,2-glucan synthetase
LWALSPFIAWRISLPPKLAEAQILSRREARSLRLVARRTWRFFETFVVADENFLPPDNFQEDPEPVIAHRTSPTNIGLYLLSTTVAHDLGTIGILDMAKRLEDTLETTSRLQRHRGHLFNWYDTQDLRPLDPAYVSTVDSGNLAGHLIAVAQACHERMQRPLFGAQILEGIRDALELLRESAEQAERPRRAQTVSEAHLREAAEAMEAALESLPASLPGWVHRLAELAGKAETLLDVARTLANDAEPEARSEVVAWAKSVRDCVASHARDLDERFEDPGGSPLARRLSPSHCAPSSWSTKWTSGSCSTLRASCSRSAIARRRARSIPTATTCWPPKRGWEASWPSPRAMSPRATGSCWAARSRPSVAGPPWSPGPAPCSST